MSHDHDGQSTTAAYVMSCRTEFWQEVFSAELSYLLPHLQPGDKILSVGCGPAIIEKSLQDRGFSVTGLDISEAAIAAAPDSVRTVVAAAERMPFADAVFDVVLFIVSLQFVDDMRQAVTEAGRVLKPGGLLIVMLLNPESSFFRRKQTEHGSYIRKIRHTDLHELEAAVNTQVNAQAEYFLGIDKARIFPSRAPGQAALYVLHGRKERRADRTASDDNRRTSPLS